jgi:hypothetical protein
VHKVIAKGRVIQASQEAATVEEVVGGGGGGGGPKGKERHLVERRVRVVLTGGMAPDRLKLRFFLDRNCNWVQFFFRQSPWSVTFISRVVFGKKGATKPVDCMRSENAARDVSLFCDELSTGI